MGSTRRLLSLGDESQSPVTGFSGVSGVNEPAKGEADDVYWEERDDELEVRGKPIEDEALPFGDQIDELYDDELRFLECS